jgi:hypothetical protein
MLYMIEKPHELNLENIVAEKSQGAISDLRHKYESDGIVVQERALISADSDLQNLYTEIIENGDRGTLIEKTQAQINAFAERYFSATTTDISDLFAEQKLHQWVAFVEDLKPIRADKNDFPEYLSPEQTGVTSSYGPQDVLCYAEQYIYGSFSGIGHNMSRGVSVRELDEKDLRLRGQIVMNDVANVVARTPAGDSIMKKYIVNLFDYEGGKKLLALYLAYVFESPEHAHAVLSREGGPLTAQRHCH